ncbi:hypothetical protein DRE_02589 [Drechslerella stenobrocha 248]|uniref:Peptidase metallopeptidase domain-containing protein n=1 Tax=Drechslerella stenobrocha 248 TaxID=1043628 RepID=W7IFU4_9PEZI|nr:hypothetical protein DRE_02589 [Drechslerella stenobrocha 248]
MALKCSASDPYRRRILSREQDDLKNSPNKWPSRQQFRWRLTGTVGGLRRSAMERAIARALRRWAAYTGFTFVRVENGANLEITVCTPDVDDPDFPYLGDNSAIAAHASMGPYGSSMFLDERNTFQAAIKLNNTKTGPKWNIRMFHNVILHESGHVLGLGHSLVLGAVMNRSIDEGTGGFTTELPLGGEDIKNIRAYYEQVDPDRVCINCG